MQKQPEQQQQSASAQTYRCPVCKQPMRLVGRESVDGTNAELATFQCQCGQVLATMVQ